MNKVKAVIDLKRFVRWNDHEAKDRLISNGMLIPLPKEMIHALHNPDECWKCAFDACGFMGIYYMLRRKWGKINQEG